MRLIDAAPNRLYRMILVLLYATGVAGPKRQGSRSKTRQPAHGHPHPPGQGAPETGMRRSRRSCSKSCAVAVEEARAAISFPAPLVSAAVSVGQYTEFCARTTRPLPPRMDWLADGISDSVVDVAMTWVWKDAVSYCEWLSGQTGKTYRLLRRQNGKKLLLEPTDVFTHGVTNGSSGAAMVDFSPTSIGHKASHRVKQKHLRAH